MNDVEDYACDFIRSVFMDIDYFEYDSIYKSVTFEDIKSRFNNLFLQNNVALSVINPV